MKQNSSKGENSRKTVYYYAGAGLVIGAAIGTIFGPMLFENLAQGSGIAIGAAVGLVVGAVIDAQGRRETDSDDQETIQKEILQ